MELNDETVRDLIKSPEMTDLSISIIDSVLANEAVLANFPIISIIHSAKKICGGISDKIFLKKLLFTMYEIKDTTAEARDRLLMDLEDQDETGLEKISAVINSLNSVKKTRIFGRICKLKIEGEIDLEEFNMLTHLIYSASLEVISSFLYSRNFTFRSDFKLLQNPPMVANKFVINDLIYLLENNAEGRDYKNYSQRAYFTRSAYGLTHLGQLVLRHRAIFKLD